MAVKPASSLIDLVASKRDADGRPSRWNTLRTLRALRVLRVLQWASPRARHS